MIKQTIFSLTLLMAGVVMSQPQTLEDLKFQAGVQAAIEVYKKALTDTATDEEQQQAQEWLLTLPEDKRKLAEREIFIARFMAKGMNEHDATKAWESYQVRKGELKKRRIKMKDIFEVQDRYHEAMDAARARYADHQDRQEFYREGREIESLYVNQMKDMLAEMPQGKRKQVIKKLRQIRQERYGDKASESFMGPRIDK